MEKNKEFKAERRRILRVFQDKNHGAAMAWNGGELRFGEHGNGMVVPGSPKMAKPPSQEELERQQRERERQQRAADLQAERERWRRIELMNLQQVGAKQRPQWP